MARVAGLLLVLLAACAKKEEPPAVSPESSKGPPPAGAGLLPRETLLYVEATSVEALERDLPWTRPLLALRLRPMLEGARFSVPKGQLDESAPIAFGLAGQTADDCYGVLFVPVRDPEIARKGVALGGATAHAGAGCVGISQDSRYVPGDTMILADLPEGVVRGRLDPAPLLRSLKGALAGAPLDFGPVVDALRGITGVTFAVRRDGQAVCLDADLAVPATAPPRAAQLREVISWLPRDAALVVAEDVDMAAVIEAIEPLVPLLKVADPSFGSALGLWSLAGRGFAASASFGAKGIELVAVGRAKDPERILAAYAEYVRAQARTGGVTVESGPDVSVGDVSLRTLYMSPGARERDDPDLWPGSTVLVFRVAAPADGPADWRDRDRAEVERRLVANGCRVPLILLDDEYLVVSRSSGADLMRPEIPADPDPVVPALSGRGEVRIRRAVDPDHPSYAAYHARLEEALASGGDPPFVIPASERVKRDVAVGEFQDGLAWCRIAPEAESELPRAFKQRGYFLVALDHVDLSAEDVEWAYVSTARLGEDSGFRDVAYRLRGASVARAETITRGSGPRYIAALIDGAVVAGARLDEPHGACGDFKHLSPATAQRLVFALSSSPFHATYAFEGEKPESFLWRRKSRAAFARVFGERGIPLRFGAVGDRIVVIGGTRDGLAEEVIARARNPGPAPLPSLVSSLKDVPEAAVLIRLDVSAARAEIVRLMDAMRAGMRAEAPSSEETILPGFPKNLEPCTLAAWRGAGGFHFRLRIDARLLDYVAAQADADRENMARYRAAALAVEISIWQHETKETRIPTLQELDFGEATDPWGEPYRIESTPSGVRVVSAGPDGAFGTDDDITGGGD